MNAVGHSTLLSMLERSTRGAFVVGRPVPTLKRIVKPPLTWEAAEPGLQFPMLEYTVTETDVAWYLRLGARLGLSSLRAAHDEVPIGLFADEPMQCVATLFGRSGRLHAAHSIHVYRSIPLESTIRSRATIVDRRRTAARKFVDVECRIHFVSGEDEIEAVRITATLVP